VAGGVAREVGRWGRGVSGWGGRDGDWAREWSATAREGVGRGVRGGVNGSWLTGCEIAVDKQT
jgi:hypothetical protein